jgi:DNA repair protein RecO (recombination protein O)
MPRHQSESIILRTFPIAEQDKLVVFFGRQRGIFKGVAKGARKFSNRFGSSLEPMSHVTAFYYEKEGRELVTVSGCDLLESFFELQAASPGGDLVHAGLFRRTHRGFPALPHGG